MTPRLLLVLGFALLAACGLSTVATGDDLTLDGGASSPSGPGADSAVDAGAPVACDGGMACGETCTDITSDPANCGGCGKPCATGEACNGGTCALLCLAPTLDCGGTTCTDVTTDHQNCGMCNHACAAEDVCSNGACGKSCMPPQTQCPDPPPAPAAYCADTTTDANNCGMCGRKCPAGQTCAGSMCTNLCANGVTVGDVFAPNMVGCAGHVDWSDRASLCGPGRMPCSAAQWVARRGTTPPSFHYWTNEQLGSQSNGNDCAAITGKTCTTTYYYGFFQSKTVDTPMRVCKDGDKDRFGNTCYGNYNCGLDMNAPNQYFGGCQQDQTAGTLCCSMP